MDYVTFVSIFSLNKSHTGLPHDGGELWLVKLGVDDFSINESNYFFFGDFGLGKSFDLKDDLIGYGLVRGRGRLATDAQYISLYPTLGFIYTVSEKWAAHTELFEYSYKKNYGRIGYSVEQRFGNSTTNDIRLKYKQAVERELRVSYSYYW